MKTESTPARSLRVLGARDILAALDGNELATIDAVAAAYLTHRAGRTSLPPSLFLRFGEERPDRIIALPAWLDDASPIAGMKWIASFPGNVVQGIDRASATLIVNSTETGRPIAVLESSIISARRTAASAALAARELHGAEETRLGIVGCGLINFEVARFARAALPKLSTLVLSDLLPERAEQFAARVDAELPGLKCEIVDSNAALFGRTPLVSLATVASTPHIDAVEGWGPETTLLHVSLRDLSTGLILEADNVVDDVDHVLKARTSVHLAEMESGRRDFIRCTLADVLAGAEPPRVPGKPLVFSPFGMGVLDLAVARQALSAEGTVVPDFLPPSWRRD